jgi:hypothetical protein
LFNAGAYSIGASTIRYGVGSVKLNVSGFEFTLIALACVETPAKAVPARMVAMVALSIDI